MRRHSEPKAPGEDTAREGRGEGEGSGGGRERGGKGGAEDESLKETEGLGAWRAEWLNG